jgi:hypothetical protein
MPRALPPFPPTLPWDARELVRLTTPALERQRHRNDAIRRAAAQAIAKENAAAGHDSGAAPTAAIEADATSAMQGGAWSAKPAGSADAPVISDSGQIPDYHLDCKSDPEPAMSPKAQPPHALIATGAAAAEVARARAALRQVCDLLGLAYLCPHAACGRIRRCKGDPAACIPALAPSVPAPARAWVRGLIAAQENGLDGDEARDEVADWEDAHTVWLAGLRAGSRPGRQIRHRRGRLRNPRAPIAKT